MFNVAQSRLQVQIHLGEGDVTSGIGRSKDYQNYLPVIVLNRATVRHVPGTVVDYDPALVDKSKEVVLSFADKAALDSFAALLYTLRSELPGRE